MTCPLTLNSGKSNNARLFLVGAIQLTLLIYGLASLLSTHHFLFSAVALAFFCLVFLGLGLVAQERLDWTRQSSRFVSACQFVMMACCGLSVLCIVLAAITKSLST